MKKIVLLFSLILITQSAHAFIDSQYMKEEQFLVNTGYSSEMANMIKVTSENPYREEYSEGTTKKDKLLRLYNYLIPGQINNLDFYNHSGKFNGSSWIDY